MGTLFLALAAGCSSSGRSSDSVPAPAGSKWQRAWVETRMTSEGGRPEFGLGSGGGTEVEVHTVVLAGTGGEARVEIGWQAGEGRPLEVLRFSADGRLLAVSADGERTWRFCWLDADPPLFCEHAVAEASGGDPFLQAPRLRDLVLGILRPAQEGVPGGRPHPFGESRHDELTEAGWYATRHAAEDPELRTAFARAVLDAGTVRYQWGYPEAAKLARDYEDVRAIFTAGLDGPFRMTAASVLARVPDSRSARDLAAALKSACAGNDPRPVLRLVWALATVLVALDGGSEDSVAALENVLGSEDLLLGKKSPPDMNLSVFLRRDAAAAYRFAVKGLTPLARSSPAARALLEKVASGPRRRRNGLTSQVLEEQAVVSGFSLEIQDLDADLSRDQESYYEPGCWARAALEWLDRKR